jgi:hypothetical protein
VAGDDQALDLVGALEDLGDLGLAHVALDREVRVYPAPPKTWTASVVTFIAASVATSFATDASLL